MNKRKIRLVFGIVTIAVLAVLSVCVMLPVDYDAGACRGGFDKYISEKYMDDFDRLVHEGLGEDYIRLSDVEDVSRTVELAGREIRCSVQYAICGDNNNSVVIIDFVGKRYWFEKYSWKLDVRDEAALVYELKVSTDIEKYTLTMSSLPGIPIKIDTSLNETDMNLQLIITADKGRLLLWDNSGKIRYLENEFICPFEDRTVYWTPLNEDEDTAIEVVGMLKEKFDDAMEENDGRIL